MLKDQTGLEMSGAAEAVAAYDRSMGHWLRLQPEVVEAADAALAADPGCVMARALGAYMRLGSSEGPLARRAGALMVGAEPANDRERRHLSAIQAWSRGDWHGAARGLGDLVEAYPTDTLALAVGHQLDFFLGDAETLKGRIARALPAWDRYHPHYGYILGMLAFGLEESGDYARAEATGLHAVERNPDDVWAIHAVAHVHEMQGRTGDGLAFLGARRADWSEGTLFNVHIAWHEALFALEHEDHAAALAVYDQTLHHPGSEGVALEMVDAAALLWRLHLDGVDVGGRWTPLADAWAAADPAPWYAFNDLHALMALLGAGRGPEAEAIVRRLETAARDGDPALGLHAMLVPAGLGVARGLLAFGAEDYAGAVAWLEPVRARLSAFGGSHAQRDVFQRTLLVAAERSGQTALARRLVDERLAARPSSAWARAHQARLA
jgi:tetratricopeptide (TPR) repeat protein